MASDVTFSTVTTLPTIESSKELTIETGNNATKRERFMRLYHPVHDRFVRFCRAKAYGHYDPEDLVNDTVLKAFEQLDHLKNEAAFLHFLFGISRNMLRNHARRLKHRGEYDENKAAQLAVHEQRSDAAVDVGLLYEALNELPEEQREAVILFEISGFSIKEIQAIQGAGASAVKQRLVRGRKKLAELLKEPNHAH